MMLRAFSHLEADTVLLQRSALYYLNVRWVALLALCICKTEGSRRDVTNAVMAVWTCWTLTPQTHLCDCLERTVQQISLYTVSFRGTPQRHVLEAHDVAPPVTTWLWLIDWQLSLRR